MARRRNGNGNNNGNGNAAYNSILRKSLVRNSYLKRVPGKSPSAFLSMLRANRKLTASMKVKAFRTYLRRYKR